MPTDTEMTPVSRTIWEDQLVDEMIFKFTHTIPMDWMLPGIPPTGNRVEVPVLDPSLPANELMRRGGTTQSTAKNI